MATIALSAPNAAPSVDQVASAAALVAPADLVIVAHVSAAASSIDQAMSAVSSAASAIAAAAPKPESLISSDAIANSAATLIGAFVGALAGAGLAYYFQTRHQKKLDKRAAVITAHRIAFCVFQQSDTILKYQRDFVLPHLDDPNRFVSIPGSLHHDEGKFTFTVNDLLPLFDDPKLRAVLYNLYSAQEAYTTAMIVWNERAKIHIGEMQPRLADGGIKRGGMHTWVEIQNALGPYILPKIASMTMTAQLALQNAFLALEEMRKPFFEYIKSRFPEEKFTEFDTPEEARIREPIVPIDVDRSVLVSPYGRNAYVLKSISIHYPPRGPFQATGRGS
jgi:hypothetical protein